MKNKFLLLLLTFLLNINTVAAETVMEIIPLSHRPAADIESVIVPLLDSSDSIVANGFNLVVKTTPEKLRKIKDLIKQLDTALNNLSITVIQSKDISADHLNAGADVYIDIPIDRPSQTQGEINAGIQQKQHHKSSQSQQVLRTLEGTPAYIKVGSNYPVQNIYIYDSVYGQRSISRQTQLIEATTGFAVLPRLNGDQVILEISPWSDEMQQYGNIETQSSSTSIRTQLGKWVEIAAIDEQQQSENTGLLSHGQHSGSKTLRILVKVEKAD